MSRTKQPKPYYTTYPRPAWYWFDTAVYGTFSPKIGDLPTATFNKLESGVNLSGSRKYANEAEARADLEQAKNKSD